MSFFLSLSLFLSLTLLLVPLSIFFFFFSAILFTGHGGKACRIFRPKFTPTFLGDQIYLEFYPLHYYILSLSFFIHRLASCREIQNLPSYQLQSKSSREWLGKYLENSLVLLWIFPPQVRTGNTPAKPPRIFLTLTILTQQTHGLYIFKTERIYIV